MPSLRLSRRWCGAFVSLIVFALSALPANAAIGVTPLSAVITPSESTASFSISNPDQVERVVQLEISRWERVDGKDRLTKTADWIVNPPVLNIPAQSTRVVRMALRRRVAVSEELSYRLVLSEVHPRADNAALGVAVNTHVSLPLFVEPETVSKKKPEWSLSREGTNHVIVKLNNTTAVHVHVTSFTVRDPSGKVAAFSTPSYVFAGETRTWPLELAKGAPDIRTLIVEAHTDDGQTIPIGSR